MCSVMMRKALKNQHFPQKLKMKKNRSTLAAEDERSDSVGFPPRGDSSLSFFSWVVGKGVCENGGEGRGGVGRRGL